MVSVDGEIQSIQEVMKMSDGKMNRQKLSIKGRITCFCWQEVTAEEPKQAPSVPNAVLENTTNCCVGGVDTGVWAIKSQGRHLL